MTQITTPLRLGIAGLGTVGGGVVKLLQEHAGMLAERAGRPLEVIAVSARDPSKMRGFDLGDIRFEADARNLLNDDRIDVIVEVIGGSEGIAKEVVEGALARGKHVVTANKALIAHHGLSLAQMAEKTSATLAFEAAVAGGIPVIKALRDGLAANRFHQIVGILNGTCNYILTQMWERKATFDDVLKEAQAKGYAEAEPSFDVDGIDTAHKLAILSSLAFGCAPAISQVKTAGIRSVTLTDMQFAAELGYRIKLLGIARLSEAGLEQKVHPTMVPASSPLANVHDVFNAVVAEGDRVGTVFFEGRGAGEGPTASSVVADIMDIARGVAYKPLTLPVASLKDAKPVAEYLQRSAYYVRLAVIDRPGVLAEVTAVLRDQQISLKTFLQHSHAPGETVQLVLTTHVTTESAMQKALGAIATLTSVKEPPHVIRIEHL